MNINMRIFISFNCILSANYCCICFSCLVFFFFFKFAITSQNSMLMGGVLIAFILNRAEMLCWSRKGSICAKKQRRVRRKWMLLDRLGWLGLAELMLLTLWRADTVWKEPPFFFLPTVALVTIKNVNISSTKKKETSFHYDITR